VALVGCSHPPHYIALTVAVGDRAFARAVEAHTLSGTFLELFFLPVRNQL
jgi:hypothetical protein